MVLDRTSVVCGLLYSSISGEQQNVRADAYREDADRV